MIFSLIEKISLSFFQRAVLSYTYFLRNELRNHAAAAAYYMLLSVIPLVLFLLFIFETFLAKYPNFSDELFYLLSTFSANITPEMFRSFGISESTGKAIGIFGLLNLVWSSRLILMSVQRAFFVIFPTERKRNFVVENSVSFLILPAVFILVTALTVFSGMKGLALEYLQFYGLKGAFVVKLLGFASMGVSAVVGFTVVFLSYRYIPVTKPNNKSAFCGSMLFIFLYAVIKLLAFKMFNLFSINTAYGLVGTIIVLLMWAYLVFLIYFFCAQFVFVCFKADILILNMLFSSEKLTPLFLKVNSYFIQRYSRSYAKGQEIFFQGDNSKEIYFIFEGELDIIINGSLVGTLGCGEIFGEMAHITGEKRSATVVAKEYAKLIVLSPSEFDEILKESHVLSRRIITSLCSRLRKTDEALHAVTASDQQQTS